MLVRWKISIKVTDTKSKELSIIGGLVETPGNLSACITGGGVELSTLVTAEPVPDELTLVACRSNDVRRRRKVSLSATIRWPARR